MAPVGAGRLTALDWEDTKVLNMASATKTRQVGLFSPPTRRSGGSRLYSEGGD